MEIFYQESVMKGGKGNSDINPCHFTSGVLGNIKTLFLSSPCTFWASIDAITIVISRPSAETHATDDRSHASPDEDEGWRVRRREKGLTWASVPVHIPYKPMSSCIEDCSVVVQTSVQSHSLHFVFTTIHPSTNHVAPSGHNTPRCFSCQCNHATC